MPVLLSLAMGAILGFSAHRAGLCTVKAVAEVLTSRRGRFLWSFAKSAAWVMATTALVGALGAGIDYTHWPFTAASVAGGVLFGVGAGINGGCTFSTLSRTMDGNLAVLGAVACWPLGMLAALLLPLPPIYPVRGAHSALPFWLLLPLGLWLLWEGLAIVRRLRRAGTLRRALGAPVYTLSAAAALVGLSNAVLLEASGPWSFTGAILCGIGADKLARCDRPALPCLIVLAALAGMAASAWQRGSFAMRRPRLRPTLRHATGGFLMGAGATLIPGGNDGLILFGIPSLSPHAVPAYLALLLGILATLMTMRALGRTIPPVLCEGDICRSL